MPVGPRGRARAAVVLLAVAVGAANPAVLAEPPRPAPAPPRLPPVGAELVQLDVVVTGRTAAASAASTAADFEILEDGKPQPVSHFAEEARPGFRAGAAAPAAPGAVAGSSAAAPAPAARGRHFVLAVDDLHTAAGNLAAAKTAMNRFVDEQVSPDDFVALVTTSGSVGVYQDFTRDRARCTARSTA